MGQEPADTAGRSVEDFTKLVGISRTTFYRLPVEHRPESIKIGHRLVVTETPMAWIERMKRIGSVDLVRKESA